MLKAAIALSPKLEKRLRDALDRKRELFNYWGMNKENLSLQETEKIIQEIEEIDQVFTSFGRDVFRVAVAQSQQVRGTGTESPRTIH